jgi:hypothetical protein
LTSGNRGQAKRRVHARTHARTWPRPKPQVRNATGHKATYMRPGFVFCAQLGAVWPPSPKPQGRSEAVEVPPSFEVTNHQAPGGVPLGTNSRKMNPWSSQLAQRRSKKCHPSSCRRSTIFRVESTRMAFIACCGIACTIQSFFREKRHRLLVCRPNPRFNNTNDL